MVRPSLMVTLRDSSVISTSETIISNVSFASFASLAVNSDYFLLVFFARVNEVTVSQRQTVVNPTAAQKCCLSWTQP